MSYFLIWTIVSWNSYNIIIFLLKTDKRFTSFGCPTKTIPPTRWCLNDAVWFVPPLDAFAGLLVEEHSVGTREAMSESGIRSANHKVALRLIVTNQTRWQRVRRVTRGHWKEWKSTGNYERKPPSRWDWQINWDGTGLADSPENNENHWCEKKIAQTAHSE